MEQDGTGGSRRGLPRWVFWAGLGAALLAGGALRWPGIRAAYPYLTYVDEGHVLQPARDTLARGHWDPAMSAYPALPDVIIASSARLLSPLAGKVAIAPPRDRARLEMSYYDRIEPPELILLSRSISWLLGLGVVALAGLLGRRLGGALAGVVAAWCAALVPALVMRGAVVMVDAYSTFFAAAALFAVPLADSRRLYARALTAGACCGMAAISKYPVAVVLPGVAATLALLVGLTLRRRLLAVGAAGAGAALAVAVLMPATWQQPRALLERFEWIASIYDVQQSGSLWSQMFVRHEFDLPQIGTPELGYVFVAAALAGLALLVLRPRTRAFGIGAAVFTALLLALGTRYTFQAFRNALPAVPLACAAVGVAVGALGERLGRPRTTTAIALGVIAALFLPAALVSAQTRSRLVDSRHQAIEWLLEHRQGSQPLLVADELAIPRQDAERLGAKAVIAPWEEWPRRLREIRPRFLLTGDLTVDGRPLIPPEDRAWILKRYEVVATLGDQAASSGSWAWRGNHLRVWVLRRSGRQAGATEPRD